MVSAEELAGRRSETLRALGEVAGTPWETPEWLIAAASSFRSWSPRALVVSDADDILSAVVVGTPDRSRTAPLRVVADTEICEPTDIPAASPAAADMLARSLIGLGRPVLLSRLAPGSLVAEAIVSQAGRRAVVRGRAAAATPACAFHLPPPGSADAFGPGWQSGVLRRAERKLAVETRVERPSVEDAARAYDDFLHLENSGWKGRAGTAVAGRPELRAFYRQYLTAMARSGRLIVTRVLFDGELAGLDLHVEVQERLWGMKLARNERFDRFGPGRLVLRQAILGAHAAGLKSYEFCGVFDDWQKPFSNNIREYLEIRAYPLAPYGAAALARQGALSLRSRARRVALLRRPHLPVGAQVVSGRALSCANRRRTAWATARRS